MSSFSSSYVGKMVLFASVLFSVSAFADIGGMAKTLNDNLSSIADLIGSIGYVAGLGFGVASVFKFKQHRDSPTQVPIGTPFAMLGVAVALIYMPTLLTEAGSSAFEDGTDVQGAAGSYSTLGGGE